MSQKRERRYVRIARLALQVAEASLPRYKHPNSPKTYTLPQLVACVLLKVYLNLSYRDSEEWLLASAAVCAVLGLDEQVPDYSTLQRAAAKIRLKDLERMNQALLAQVGPDEEELVGLDSTGYSPTQASWHSLSRAKRVRRHYLKGVYAVGCASQLILAMRTELGPSSDVDALTPLRAKVRPYVRKNGWCLLGDRGCDGRQSGAGDLIPPMRRGRRGEPRDAARDVIWWMLRASMAFMVNAGNVRPSIRSLNAALASILPQGHAASSGANLTGRRWPITSMSDPADPLPTLQQSRTDLSNPVCPGNSRNLSFLVHLGVANGRTERRGTPSSWLSSGHSQLTV